MDNDDDVVELLIESLARAHQRIGQLETDRGNLHARIEKLMRENQALLARQPASSSPDRFREVS